MLVYKAAIGIIVVAIGAGGALAGSSRSEVASPHPVAVAQPATPSRTTTTPPTTTTTQPPPPPPTTAPPTTTPPSPPATTTTRPRPTTTTPKPKPKPAPAPAPAVGAPCNETARACIDLSANLSWLLDHGRVIYGPVPITSGRPGWRTPTGTFHVLYKDIDHKSELFDDAPMPYSVFFNGGIAFHAGSLSVPSHGCIHLSTAAAKTYYNTLQVGDVVQVVP